MTEHAADLLLNAVDRTAAPVCVGLDPVIERIPSALAGNDPADRLRAFSESVLDAVVEHVPCVKFQAACYERYGHRGVDALERSIAAARARGIVVILDAKRGDIGISAAHYAAAAFETARADWVTVNPYLGEDGLLPFRGAGRGAFALVRTSNPSGDAVQAERLEDGRTVAEAVADLVADLGAGDVGTRGYSGLGAVVGATKPEDAAHLRARMPQQIFLVPGYGAQGGGVEDVLPSFDEGGTGAIVTASRSVIYAGGDDAAWTDAVATAAGRLADEIGRAVGMR
jgi:orotidine-5'-phosphate decarboxylase